MANSVSRCAATVAALALALQPTLPAVSAQTQAKPAAPTTATPTTPTTAKPATTTAKPTPASAPAQTAPAQVTEPVWPRGYQTPSGGQVIVYLPQVSSWTSQKKLVAHSAVSYRPKTAAANEKAKLGAITLEAETSVSLEERLVNMTKLTITDAHFPELPKESIREVITEITASIPPEGKVIALDRVLAAVDKSTIIPKDVPGLKADPPTIFFSQTPALLVNFDGEPVWSPIDKNDLRFAVNTNWDVFEHPPTKTYYLLNEKVWLKTTDLKAGPWTAAGELPASFKTLPAEENFKEVKSAVPGQKPSGPLPKVFVSYGPAEMILLRGAPVYSPVPSTKLVWVSNTDSDVFRMGTTGAVYYLVSGRWFSSPGFEGPWTFATPSMPEDFKKIPLEHDRSRVLASVPGTEQAIEGVLLAQVPQTARVSKSQIKAPEVDYQGTPQFEAIPSTSVQRAVNTDKDVILVGTTYYLCYQGVWFTATGPQGPWSVATTIPSSVYQIPASSPAHNVTYVVIEEDDDDNDEWVTFAAVAGYTGLMIGWGCAVYGSGWYYPPYVWYGGYRPIYYPYPHSYGYSAWYNPWSGTYGRSAVAYGPYGGVGATARYNPRTGTYARGAAAYGPYGARGAAQAYNPRTGAYGQTRQGANGYGSWGSTSVQRGDDWVQTNRVTNNRTGTTTRTTRTDNGAMVSRNTPGPGGSFAAVGEGGNMYAGRDGNVYRNTDGSWQKYDNGSWGNVDKPAGTGERAGAAGTNSTARTGSGTNRSVDSSTMGQLERDRAARSSGTQKTRDYSTSRSSSRPSSGSYRGGGMSRGGGRRR